MKIRIKKHPQNKKWDWATPEKLNPNYRKQSMQGACILIGMGIVTAAVSFLLAEYLRENFVSAEDKSAVEVIQFLTCAPFCGGLAMLGAGMRSLMQQLFSHLY